jgi:hypothetical protein
MKSLLDILLFPLGVLIEAFVGRLHPAENAKMRTCRRCALTSLAGCIGMFALVLLFTAIAPHSLAVAPLAAVGPVLLFAFLIAGKRCSDEAENSKNR